jgi:hypothetical protein
MVIDNDVFDEFHQNIALPKSHFADYISNKIDPFHDIDFSAFIAIFDVIEQIIRENSPEKSLPVAVEYQPH